eukprot:SAG11_NODE_24_length_24699_cov_10.132195_8_plen_67_part_00
MAQALEAEAGGGAAHRRRRPRHTAAAEVETALHPVGYGETFCNGESLEVIEVRARRTSDRSGCARS